MLSGLRSLNLVYELSGWLDETTAPFTKSTLCKLAPRLHLAIKSENELVSFVEFAIVLGAET